MFIQTQDTPNPQTLKFLPGRTVLETGTVTFDSPQAAKGVCPLAADLLAIAEIRSVFLGGDFISVTKAEAARWEEIKPEILTLIMEHMVAGKPLLLEKKAAAASVDDDELSKQIRALIEERVRPVVAQDGGDIVFHRFEAGIVYLEMHGACSGCPSSTMTLKNGIENMLKHYVPEVQAVEAVR